MDCNQHCTSNPQKANHHLTSARRPGGNEPAWRTQTVQGLSRAVHLLGSAMGRLHRMRDLRGQLLSNALERMDREGRDD